MQKYFMRSVKLMTLTIVAIALVACGRRHNSGYDGVTIPGMGTASISGYVSGGAIAVVDAASNAEVRRVASIGYAAGLKTFSTSLAIGKSYKFYLIDNAGTADERVYPLYQGTANKFAITTTNSLDFGFVSTTSGVAIPANDITQIRGVASDGEDKTFPANLAASAFTNADLQGSWQTLQIVSGSNPRWVRSSITLAADGTSTGAYTSSLDSGTTEAATYTITPGGVVTVQSGLSTIFSGMMARDKSMIIGTSSPSAGNYGLVIMIKSGTVYAVSDLQGNWKYNQLIASTGSAWAHGDAGIDANGAISVTNATSSASPVPDTLSGKLSIESSGIVAASSSHPSFYGVMSADKELLFAISTNSDNSPNLMIFTRVNGLTFSTGDLLGMWRANWLSTTSSTSSTSYWGRAFLNVDSGNSYLQSILQSYGASADAAITTGIAKNGVVSFTNTDFSGIIALGKNFVVGTMTNGSGDFTLYTFIK